MNRRYCGCPKCDAVFILTDEKLNQCAGLVRCGACQEAFDAKTNLMQKTDTGFVAAAQIDETEMGQARNPFEPRATDSIHVHDDKQDHGRLTAPTIAPLNFDPDREDSPAPADSHDALTEAPQIEPNSRSESQPESQPENMRKKEFEFINLKMNNPKEVDQASSGSSVRPPSQNSTMEDTTLCRMSGNRVGQYINDRTHPFVTFIWLMAAIGFVFLLGMQVKYFFVERYAQDQTYRKYLVGFCKIAGCDLSPRQGPLQFTLTHTRIDLHPTEPGALRVTVKLVNEAKFAQPYPHLQLTLTDRAGRVVGRRTFSPELYLANDSNNMSGNMIAPGELASIVFNLARPHEKAVGFVVDIVTAAAAS
ncbi:zinc-ribbon and DUF3426 domain-containing protein [Candidatus Spongiihabitans sp.]|uniref:zinc-ribbon and DUF3426 domain-containing protein n=1 Tax=Candidatus Spongiihabitans sp. TaxID=3101308 RepID=UPI003C7D1213